MPRFLTGDELGNIKSLRYEPGETVEGKRVALEILQDRTSSGKVKSIQKLALSSDNNEKLVTAAHADGSISLSSFDENDCLTVIHEEKESRFKLGQKFVGLAIHARDVFSCTSNGALQMITHTSDQGPTTERTSLPMRLCDWRISSNRETFAYGGDEVDLSVWDTEKAFAPRLEAVEKPGTKRKRGDELFPGETWRAKNVPNDFLGLRQPVHITSLTYLSSSPSASQHHLVTGTLSGDVRRYDTRAARRPVANWQGIGKLGGIKVIEKGHAEHELFVSDGGSNLFSLDLRNGRIAYGYKGLSGAVTSIAPSSSVLASTSLDRYGRIHNVYPPADETGKNQKRAETIEKIYMTSIPTAVIWDQTPQVSQHEDAGSDDEGDVWASMENAEEDSNTRTRDRRKTNYTKSI